MKSFFLSIALLATGILFAQSTQNVNIEIQNIDNEVVITTVLEGEETSEVFKTPGELEMLRGEDGGVMDISVATTSGENAKTVIAAKTMSDDYQINLDFDVNELLKEFNLENFSLENFDISQVEAIVSDLEQQLEITETVEKDGVKVISISQK